MEQEDRLLTISEVSKILNISKHTLRFWEKGLMGLFTPQRTQGGQRRFTRKDLMQIEEIKKMRDRGTSLEKIKECFFHGNSNHDSLQRIERLSHKIAEMVRSEIYQFFLEGPVGDNK